MSMQVNATTRQDRSCTPPDIPPGYGRTDVGIVPEDWQLHAVGKMGEVVAGKALAAKAPGEQRPYLRTKNVFDGRIDLKDVLSMPMTATQFTRFRLQHGDVLLNEGQSLELVGRCALYGGEFGAPCAIQNQLIRFRARDGVSSEFAAHLFRHCQHTGVFARIALQTTSVAHLGVSRFERLVLAWPVDKTEQQAIAGMLSDTDHLIEATEKLIAKKRAIKQATMQQLLTGRTRLPGFSDTWRRVKLGDIATMGSGGTPPSGVSRFYGGGVPWVSISDMTGTGKHVRVTEKTITQEGVASSAARLYDPGVVLYAMYASLGECALPVGRLSSSQAILGILPGPSLDREYLYYYLTSIKTKVRRLGQQGTQSNLNAGMVRGFEIELPSVNEQHAIAQVLGDMDVEVEALESRLAKIRDLKIGMMQELLTGRTRLVPPKKTAA